MPVGPFGCERALDQHLGGDAGVIGAGLEERLEALHALEAHECVDQRVVEGVPEMEIAGDVRWRDHDREGGLAARRIGSERFVGPAPDPAPLDGRRVVARCELQRGVGALGVDGVGRCALGIGHARSCRRGTAARRRVRFPLP